jgi:hypothetical protein
MKNSIYFDEFAPLNCLFGNVSKLHRELGNPYKFHRIYSNYHCPIGEAKNAHKLLSYIDGILPFSMRQDHPTLFGHAHDILRRKQFHDYTKNENMLPFPTLYCPYLSILCFLFKFTQIQNKIHH